MAQRRAYPAARPAAGKARWSSSVVIIRYRSVRVPPSSAVTVRMNSMTRTVMAGSGLVSGGLPARRRLPFLRDRLPAATGSVMRLR
jgi:hypothetical protein